MSAALIQATLGSAYGDSLTASFDIDQGLNTVPSVGQLTLTLNFDGSIAGTLTDTKGSGQDGAILVLGINSNTPTQLDLAGFSEPSSINTFISTSAFGNFQSGFQNSGTLVRSETFTITGSFASVWDVLGGGASYDFVLLTNPYAGGGEILYAANGVASTVPEPSSLALVCLGGLGFAIHALRKRTAA